MSNTLSQYLTDRWKAVLNNENITKYIDLNDQGNRNFLELLWSKQYYQTECEKYKKELSELFVVIVIQDNVPCDTIFITNKRKITSTFVNKCKEYDKNFLNDPIVKEALEDEGRHPSQTDDDIIFDVLNGYYETSDYYITVISG